MYIQSIFLLVYTAYYRRRQKNIGSHHTALPHSHNLSSSPTKICTHIFSYRLLHSVVPLGIITHSRRRRRRLDRHIVLLPPYFLYNNIKYYKHTHNTEYKGMHTWLLILYSAMLPLHCNA